MVSRVMARLARNALTIQSIALASCLERASVVFRNGWSSCGRLSSRWWRAGVALWSDRRPPEAASVDKTARNLLQRQLAEVGPTAVVARFAQLQAVK